MVTSRRIILGISVPQRARPVIDIAAGSDEQESTGNIVEWNGKKVLCHEERGVGNLSSRRTATELNRI